MDYSKFIRRRLVNLGVKPKDARHVAFWYIQQIKQQGPNGAVMFFKRIGDTILNYLYGSPARPEWVATKHRFPKALYFLKKYDESILVRIAKFARAIRFDNLTENQVRKVVNGATEPYKGSVDGRALLSSFTKAGVTHLGLRGTDVQPDRPELIGKQFRRVMSVSGPTALTMEPPLLESLEIVNRVPALYNLPYWKDVFHPITPDWLEDRFERFTGTEGHAVGEIHAAQEGGGKLRMYASPYTVIQCLLYPIHYWIDRYRRTIRTDCTYNQLSGAEWAQAQLRSGTTVYSVDLSTATCRAPLEPQMELLASLGLATPFREALEWACRGEWVVGAELLPLFPETLRWAVGQPLGISPSMSMFSLWHNCLLTGMCRSLGLDPDSSFRILGDDVVMIHKGLYELYTQTMDAAGVPISWNKCHISDKVAEFAGATITSSLILRPGQWREAGINNHLSISHDLGTPLNGEVSGLWIKIQKVSLFRSGLYDPPISQWSKYIQYSTDLASLDDPSLIDCPDGHRFWETGIRSHIRKSFGALYPDFLPVKVDVVDDVFAGLPQTDNVLRERYWAVGTTDVHGHTVFSMRQSFARALCAIEKDLSASVIGYDEACRLAQLVVANTHGLLWCPPSAKRIDGAGAHNKLLAVVA